MATRKRPKPAPARTPEGFRAYIDLLAPLLSLRDWTISVGEGPPGDEEADAAIYLVPGRKVATIWFSAATVESASAEEQRHTAVHELLHCHFHLVTGLGGGLGAGARRRLNDALEYGVDGIADAVSPLMPLPGG